MNTNLYEVSSPSSVVSSKELDCDGYRKLLAAVEESEQKWAGSHNYREKFQWVLDQAKHYSNKTGLTAEAILDAWEERRDYWFMNYYQPANQPAIEGDNVRVFETVDALMASIGKAGFRCPACEAVTKSPYECDSGVKVTGAVCNWKVYGLFGHLGKGVSVFVKDKLRIEKLFMPIAWEHEILTAITSTNQ